MPRKRKLQGVILTASAAADQILWDLCKSYHVKYASLTNQAKRRFVSVFDNFKRNCIFCGNAEDNIEKYGELIHSRTGISVHYFCLLFSSGLVQTENDESCNSAETSSAIYGFSIKNILLEFARASKLHCGYCCKGGASIGCAYAKCSRKFHYPCGAEKHYLYQYFGTFAAFCSEHRPVQHMPRSITCGPQMCGICFDTIDHNVSFDVLTTPCCKNSRIHRKCAEKQALSFGLYLFRCPFCNNSDDYVNEMKRIGIYIPQRDASWETPHAYTDLLETRLICDAEKCSCKYGRKHDQPGTNWSIVGCVICSSSGAHTACASLKHANAAFVCDICKSVWGEDNIKEKLEEMGFKGPQVVVKMFTGDENDHVDVVNEVDMSIQNAIEIYECEDSNTTRRTLRSHVCRTRKIRDCSRLRAITESRDTC